MTPGKERVAENVLLLLEAGANEPRERGQGNKGKREQQGVQEQSFPGSENGHQN